MSDGNTNPSWRDKIDSKLSEMYKQYSIRPHIAASREKVNNFIAATEETSEQAVETVRSKPKQLLFETSEFLNTNPFFKYSAVVARNYEGQFLAFYTLFGAALAIKFTPRYVMVSTVSSLVYGKAFAYVSQYKWKHPEQAKTKTEPKKIQESAETKKTA